MPANKKTYQREYMQNWRAKNREKVREYQRDYKRRQRAKQQTDGMGFEKLSGEPKTGSEKEGL